MIDDLPRENRRGGLGETHPDPCPVPFQPGRHMELLLEVLLEREVKEGTSERGELQGRRPSSLDDRKVARGEVLVLNDNFCVRIAELISGKEAD